MSEKLLPCPFCGKKPGENHDGTWVRCESGRANCILDRTWYRLEAWNTRPSAALTDEEEKAVVCVEGRACPTRRRFGQHYCDCGRVVAACVRRLSTLPEAGRDEGLKAALAIAKRFSRMEGKEREGAMAVAQEIESLLSSERKPEPCDDIPPMDECPPESLYRDSPTPADRKEPKR